MAQPPFDDRARVSDAVAAYRLLLGREADPSGLAHFESLVRAGITVDDLAERFLASEECRTRRAEVLVDVDCGGYHVCVDQGERAAQNWWFPGRIDMLGPYFDPNTYGRPWTTVNSDHYKTAFPRALWMRVDNRGQAARKNTFRGCPLLIAMYSD